MIDIHNHILPGIDDGADSLHMSADMLDAAVAVGISAVVATPHLTGPLSADYDAAVRVAFRQVEALATDRGIALLPGFEVRLTPDLPARLRAGEPIALAGSQWVLVDLPFVDQWPHFVDDTLFGIQTAGFGIILAHPERCPHIQREPGFARTLVERGLALQLTAGSFAGVFGRRAGRCAEALFTLGVVHLVATDAHSAGHRMAAVGPGLRRLGQLVGESGLRHRTITAPATLLDGGSLLPPARAKRRGRIHRALAGSFG